MYLKHNWILCLSVNIFVLLLMRSITTIHCEPVDVALNKPITAEPTCGFQGEETYYNHTQIPLNPVDRTEETCYDNTTHPASHMVDGSPNTWWQSTSRSNLLNYEGNFAYGRDGNPEAFIIIDLQQVKTQYIYSKI